jgi:hypothetical protein
MNILEPENNDFHQVRIMEAASSAAGPINWKRTALGLFIALLAFLTENLVFIKLAAQAQSGRNFSGATPKVSDVTQLPTRRELTRQIR